MDPIILIIFLALVGYALASAKMVSQGNVALVERLGRYHRKLNPGLSFIVPIIDQIVMENTTREQLLDIKPQNVITKDGIYLEVDAIVYWRKSGWRGVNIAHLIVLSRIAGFFVVACF